MNTIFKPYLRKKNWYFFYDILIYSKNFISHLQHLTLTLQLLLNNQLHVKMSKCSFANTHMVYLGHIIFKDGVVTDPSKIEAMINWHKQKTVKALRGFLGLTGYYRKFIKNYGVISKRLTYAKILFFLVC
jgi:hypothetical protein